MRPQYQTPSAIPEREYPDSTGLPRAAKQGASIAALIPIMAVVLIAFLIIGLALPVLPLHVHQTLGLGAFVVGLVSGSQFGASLTSRVWAGHYADSRGAKRAVLTGLITAILAGLLYFLSLRFVATPWLSVTILLLGRALLGRAESFIITGAVIRRAQAGSLPGSAWRCSPHWRSERRSVLRSTSDK